MASQDMKEEVTIDIDQSSQGEEWKYKVMLCPKAYAQMVEGSPEEDGITGHQVAVTNKKRAIRVILAPGKKTITRMSRRESPRTQGESQTMTDQPDTPAKPKNADAIEEWHMADA